ncbi:MAG: c-type cytochrome [Gammaproteobacteria bacterium]|nr:c-type cytochrome [Gammaproteobacteria bacterium]
MTMRCLIVVLLLFAISQRVASQPVGDSENGKILWLETEHVECRDCHGDNGEGGFGPDLAGRDLTRAQFIHAVRKPWGIMPAFAESQISDAELTDLIAYFDTLPGVDEPAPWRREVPAGASRGLAAATTTGCTQCHHPLFNNGRAVMGATNATFEWFIGIVYAHTAAYPPTRASLGEPPFERLAMGSFSPSRVPESMLRDMWTYITDLGFRPRLRGQLSAGVPSSDGVVYTLTVDNSGIEGIGLTAEDVTVTLVVPSGASVVAASGAGYQGISRDEEGNADVAVWKVPRMAAQYHETFTLTLSQAGTAENDLRGRIRWAVPEVTTAFVNIAPPAPPGAPAH